MRAGTRLRKDLKCCTGWVKQEVIQSEEFGMPEIWGKNGIICVATRMYVGTSFFRR